MKKKYEVPQLDHKLWDACEWAVSCPFTERDGIKCSDCKAADTSLITREQAQSWWEARIKELNEEKEK